VESSWSRSRWVIVPILRRSLSVTRSWIVLAAATLALNAGWEVLQRPLYKGALPLSDCLRAGLAGVESASQRRTPGRRDNATGYDGSS
jgi:hypothetical protein